MNRTYIENLIRKNPGYIVLFEGANAYCAFAENAMILRHVLWCNLSSFNGMEMSSHKELETLEYKLERKNVSYVLIDRNGSLYKRVDFSGNSYGEYSRLWLKVNASYKKDFESLDYSECMKLVEGKRAFGCADTDADMLSAMLECEEIVQGSIKYSYNQNLRLIESALEKEKISYAIKGRDKLYKKYVTFYPNRYQDYLELLTSVPEIIPEEDEAVNDFVPSISDDLSTDQTARIEEIGRTEFEDFSSVRNIYFTQKFRRYYEKASREIRNNIDAILDKFRLLKEEDLRDYLKHKNNKVLQGSRYNFDKLYVDNSSGHRLVWCRADDIMLECMENSIIIIAYVENHDKGQRRAATTFDSKAALTLAFKEADELANDALSDFEDKIPPYLFYKRRFIPQLNGNQKGYLSSQPPIMLQGCAGSGKTQVSIEILSQLVAQGENPVYVTFTRELVDDIRDKVSHMPSLEDGSVREHIFSLTNFFLFMLGIERNSIKYIDESAFNKWKDNRFIHRKDARYINMNSKYAWTYIRGVICGGAICDRIPSKTEFIKWMRQQEGISDEDSETIYDIYHIYQKEVITGDTYDDNLLAEMVLNNEELRGSINTIIADEIQDLTYIQIKALIHCVRDFNIYLCGDINQRVNPTIIDLDAIRAMFYQNGKSALSTYYLGNSFRSGQGLVVFLNHLSDLRREYIGLQSKEVEVQETSLRHDSEGFWATMCDRYTVDLTQVCKIAAEAANCIVIVPNKEKKDEVISFDKRLDGRVKTVQEMKGLEYDNVILYDFLSHAKEDFTEIFNGARKRDTFGRLLFNLLYVACTRAKDRLIICETTSDINMNSVVYKDITIKDSLENVRGFMQLEVDDEGWLKEAARLEYMQQFDMARTAYSRVEKIDCSKDILKCELMSSAIKSIDENDELMEYLLKENGIKLIELEEYEYAVRLFEHLEEYTGDASINGLYAKLMSGYSVSGKYATKVFTYESEVNLLNNLEKVNKYARVRVEDNQKHLDDIKNMLKGLSYGR